MNAKWVHFEMKGNEWNKEETLREMNAAWKAMKGNERERLHLVTFDQGYFHTDRKLEKTYF